MFPTKKPTLSECKAPGRNERTRHDNNIWDLNFLSWELLCLCWIMNAHPPTIPAFFGHLPTCMQMCLKFSAQFGACLLGQQELTCPLSSGVKGFKHMCLILESDSRYTQKMCLSNSSHCEGDMLRPCKAGNPTFSGMFLGAFETTETMQLYIAKIGHSTGVAGSQFVHYQNSDTRRPSIFLVQEGPETHSNIPDTKQSPEVSLRHDHPKESYFADLLDYSPWSESYSG